MEIDALQYILRSSLRWLKMHHVSVMCRAAGSAGRVVSTNRKTGKSIAPTHRSRARRARPFPELLIPVNNRSFHTHTSVILCECDTFGINHNRAILLYFMFPALHVVHEQMKMNECIMNEWNEWKQVFQGHRPIRRYDVNPGLLLQSYK